MLKEALGEAEGGSFPYKLLLLCAPSGYGKTTLLADFVQQTSLPCCWYAFDQTDTDAITFLRMLLTSLRQRFPQLDFGTEDTLACLFAAELPGVPELADFERMLDAIIEIIEDRITERFVFIFSNYHEIGHSCPINHLVNRLLANLPEHVSVIIESRYVPPLNMASLLAHRKMVGIGSTLFRLSSEEIHQLALVQGVPPLTATESEYLATTFDGWIAGILLGTRLGNVQLLQRTSLAYHDSARQEEPVALHRQHLFSYLVDDIFGREPEVYQFLKEASILQQMTPQLCNQLLERDDALACLCYLEEHGLFVSRYGEGRQAVFTCHPLIRELLYEELQHADPDRFACLQRKAACLFQKVEEYNQAIYHALQAADYTLAAKFISSTYISMFSQGHLSTLQRWLDAIPPDVLKQNPQLLVFCASLNLAHGEQEQMLARLEEAESALSEPTSEIDADEAVALGAEIALGRGKVLYLSGQYAQAKALCQQTLEWLPIDNVRLRAEAHLRLGMCANNLGDVTNGIQELQQALQLRGRHTQSRQVARLHSQLANAYHLIGNHALSEHHRARAIHCWEALHDAHGKINNLIALGVVQQRRGAFEEAEATLRQALQSVQETHGFPQGEAYALVSFGDLYQDQGRYDQALVAIEDGLKLARRLGDHYLTVYSLCTLATTYVLMGDSATAQLLLAELNPLSEQLQGEAKERAFYDLTRGTVLLYLQRYTESIALLSTVESTVSKVGLKREQVQCLLRLASCYCTQQDLVSMQRCVESALQIAIQHGYEKLIEIELHRMPHLQQTLQTRREAAPLQTAIEEATEVPTDEELVVMMDTPQKTGAKPTVVISKERPGPATEKGAVCTPSRIQIRGMGEPAVLVNEQPITRWRMARAMELCFFLLDRQEPVHKEQIIVALWPESEEDEQADQKFRSTVYYLRKALGENCITARSGYYALDLEAVYGNSVTYDVYVFQEAAKRAKQAVADHDDDLAIQALNQVVELYRGDFVQPFYSDWCSFRRDELRRFYMEARHQLARIAWRQEQWDESATHWQYLLAIDSCMEEAHYGLMRCYMRQGKRGQALRQYQRCVTALREEMGLTPGPNLQRLYQALVEADRSPSANKQTGNTSPRKPDGKEAETTNHH